MSGDNKSNINNSYKLYDRVVNLLGISESLSLKPLILYEKFKDDYCNNDDCSDIRCILHKNLMDINKILNFKQNIFTYIKSGAYGHTFKGSLNGIQYAMKIVAYSKLDEYGDFNDIKRPENTEIKMLCMLSKLVINDITPHIVLPVCTFNTSIKTLLQTDIGITINEKSKKFVEHYNNKDYHDTISILISEWIQGGDLGDYLRDNYTKLSKLHWQVLFFQIISTLALIQEHYPSFRHNDLKANNILIDFIPLDTKIFKYTINKNDYYIPNVGFVIKLWDFDFSNIINLCSNNKVNFSDWNTDINVTPIKNKYYDLHYFFNSLTKKGFIKNFYESQSVHNDIKSFIRRIIPIQYMSSNIITKRGRIKINKEYITPITVIENDTLFDIFRDINLIVDYI